MSALEETSGVPLGAAADGRASGVSSSASATLDGRAHLSVAERRCDLRAAIASCLDSALDTQDGLSEFGASDFGLTSAQYVTLGVTLDRVSRMLRLARATMERA